MCKRVFVFLFLFCAFSATLFSAVFAILETGPVRHQGIPGPEKNRIDCLYGTYTAALAQPEVWLVSGELPLSSDWTETLLSDGRRVFTHSGSGTFLAVTALRNQNELMQPMLSWTVLFNPDTLSMSDTAVFIRLFLEQFAYFGSTVKSPLDLSFPAVLETR